MNVLPSCAPWLNDFSPLMRCDISIYSIQLVCQTKTSWLNCLTNQINKYHDVISLVPTNSHNNENGLSARPMSGQLWHTATNDKTMQIQHGCHSKLTETWTHENWMEMTTRMNHKWDEYNKQTNKNNSCQKQTYRWTG